MDFSLRCRTMPMFFALVAAGCFLPAAAIAAEISLEKVERWAPHPETAPKTTLGDDGRAVIEANGTAACAGGWQYVFRGVRGGQAYRIRTVVAHQGLAHPRDCLVARMLWDRWKPTQQDAGGVTWNYLLPRPVADGELTMECVTRAPQDATCLTVRYTLRWSEHGISRWAAPTIEEVAIAERKPLKICIVNSTRQTPRRIPTRHFPAAQELPKDVAESVDLWATLVDTACRQERPQLLVTPELVIAGKEFRQGAVTVPGPATKPFQDIAREHQAHLVLGVRERKADAVYNSAVLIGPEGTVSGVYHKVHLATGEDVSGILPGDGFPVFPTSIAPIGCLICMDTTLNEPSRLLALGGAEIICMPIMGDLRADRFSPGPGLFNESRWKALMRTRAIDNQVCMAIARNNVQGSCIIDRKGDILAWNEGDREFITATLPAEDGYRMWNGGDIREVTYLLRRPHLYGAYCDEAVLGPVGTATVPTKEPPTDNPRSHR